MEVAHYLNLRAVKVLSRPACLYPAALTARDTMFETILSLALAAALNAPVRGGVTYYYGSFEGKNLKCPGYRYEPETGPWVAVDISEYTSGATKCGDLIVIRWKNGETYLARALDSGYLDYRLWPDKSRPVWDTGLPIIADLPKYWRTMPTETATMFNISRFLRDAHTERENGRRSGDGVGGVESRRRHTLPRHHASPR